MTGDHPRIRGEHVSFEHDVDTLTGSSPHTRGAPQHRLTPHRERRIIPAYAGSTTSTREHAEMVRDHPRIRGEHGATWEIRDRSPSSSPHTRGARNLLHGNIGGAKIIPAYAGSTDDASRLCSRIEDHPRIRGEHLVIGDEKHNHRGSSPHTRGARRRPRRRIVPLRIIPAYAGSTSGDRM